MNRSAQNTRKVNFGGKHRLSSVVQRQGSVCLLGVALFGKRLQKSREDTRGETKCACSAPWERCQPCAVLRGRPSALTKASAPQELPEPLLQPWTAMAPQTWAVPLTTYVQDTAMQISTISNTAVKGLWGKSSHSLVTDN